MRKAFLKWLVNNGYVKVRTITALIFLNICGLHEYPYSEFLFFLGRLLLQAELNEIAQSEFNK